MTFRASLTRLALLSVSGVTNNYDVDAVPDEISRAQLPVLLVLPVDTPDEQLLKEDGAGFQTIAFSNGPCTVTYTVTHLLLVAPVGTGKGMRSHLPTLINRIDAYFDALAADVTLNNTLLEPAQVKVEPGVFTHGSVDYYACAFRHTWLIEV